MSYYSLDQQTFDDMKTKIDDLAEVGHTLPSWPMKFVQDMRNRLAKHGRELMLSEQQQAKITEIWEQYCQEKDTQRDATYGFNELERRDKNRRF